MVSKSDCSQKLINHGFQISSIYVSFYNWAEHKKKTKNTKQMDFCNLHLYKVYFRLTRIKLNDNHLN